MGEFDLYGSATAEATLDVGSAAGFGYGGLLTGRVNLSGDALIEFASGQITTIANGGALSLIGSHAFVADASDTSSNSALNGLTTYCRRRHPSACNGASVTTSGGLNKGGKYGAITLDGASGDGGSSLTIGRRLAN